MAVRGLGKGLGALLGDDSQDQNNFSNGITFIAVDDLYPNRYQPRKNFSNESLEELASSIKKQGVLQPIIVRSGKVDGTYELVAGERRWRASKLAGLKEIPALIREMGDRESLALALIENVQRDDLNAIEQALALQQLQSDFQATQNDLAEHTGLSRSHITNLLRLLHLPDYIQQDILENEYTSGHGRALMAITDPESQNILRNKIIQENLSVRSCEKHAAYWKTHGFFDFEPRKEHQKVLENKLPAMAKYEDFLIKEIGISKVKFRGSEDKGTMTVSYGSKDELERLLQKLGVNEIHE